MFKWDAQSQLWWEKNLISKKNQYEYENDSYDNSKEYWYHINASIGIWFLYKSVFCTKMQHSTTQNSVRLIGNILQHYSLFDITENTPISIKDWVIVITKTTCQMHEELCK